MSRLGWALFLLYLATLAYYLYVRITSTLNLGLHYQWHALAPTVHRHLLVCSLSGMVDALVSMRH